MKDTKILLLGELLTSPEYVNVGRTGTLKTCRMTSSGGQDPLTTLQGEVVGRFRLDEKKGRDLEARVWR